MLPSQNATGKQLDKRALRAEKNSVFEWLRRYLYHYGFSRGYETGVKNIVEQNGFVSLWDMQPDYRAMRFGYQYYYDCIDIFINVSKAEEERMGVKISDRIRCHRLFDRNASGKIARKDMEMLSRKVDGMIKTFFPGIQQQNGLRFCHSLVHIQYDDNGDYFGINREKVFGICKPVGMKWYCDDCESRYGIFAPLPKLTAVSQNKRAKYERERRKMTPKLRFTILDRDNFTCRACGQSPLKGDDVKLHVDHIIPLYEGGETRPANLQALCQDCNLGKGTAVTKKLSLSR